MFINKNYVAGRAPNGVKFARAQTINYGRRAEGAPNGLKFAHGQTIHYGRRMGGGGTKSAKFRSRA